MINIHILASKIHQSFTW